MSITPELLEKAKSVNVPMNVLLEHKPITLHTDEATKNLIQCKSEWRVAQRKYREEAQGDSELDAALLTALNEKEDALDKAEVKLDAAGEKDRKASDESLVKLAEAYMAQEKGHDLSFEVWGPETREYLKMSAATDPIENFRAFQDGISQNYQKEYLEAMDVLKKEWKYSEMYRSANSLAGGAHNQGMDFPLEWLLSDEDLVEVNKAADRQKFAATTTHSDFAPATGGTTRMDTIIARLFPRSIMNTLGMRQRSVPSGMVQLSVATNGVTPTGKDEEGQDAEEGMTFSTHDLQLRRISGTVATTDETELFVPGTLAITRRDMRMALQTELNRTVINGDKQNHHMGLLNAAWDGTTPAVAGASPRASAYRIPTSAADIDISAGASAARLQTMLEIPYGPLSGNFGNVIDDLVAQDESDLAFLFPSDVANRIRGQYNTQTDATAMDLLKKRTPMIQGTTLIPSALTTAVANTYMQDKKTVGFVRREPNPAAVGDVAMFPMMRLRQDQTTKQDRSIVRYTICLFCSIYVGVRPASIAMLNFVMIP